MIVKKFIKDKKFCGKRICRNIYKENFSRKFSSKLFAEKENSSKKFINPNFFMLTLKHFLIQYNKQKWQEKNKT